MRRRSRARRGPGVVGTVARTAMIAGTATAVSHGVSGRMANRAQQQQGQQQQAQAATDVQADVEEMQQQPSALQAQAAVSPTPEPQAGTDLIGQLQQLGEMKTAGLLSDAEFEAAKALVLGS